MPAKCDIRTQVRPNAKTQEDEKLVNCKRTRAHIVRARVAGAAKSVGMCPEHLEIWNGLSADEKKAWLRYRHGLIVGGVATD